METADKYPTSVGAAWERLLETLEHESVCYRAGGRSDGELLPVNADTGMNYGEAVHAAVETLMETGRWTREQILAVRQLCMWVARAARA
jgi:hypothetical protein